MSRRVIVLLLVVVVVLLLGGAAAVVATSRTDLEDDRDAVDARWAALRVPLAARYDGLGQLADALGVAGAGARAYTVDLTGELATWRDLAARRDPDPAAEAVSANRLEGLAARVRANVAQSARLSRDPGVAAAFAAFDAALVPPDDVDAYNAAVRRYQSTRTGTLTRIPADLLGYDARPALVLAASNAGGA
jgi:hypothetical protein